MPPIRPHPHPRLDPYPSPPHTRPLLPAAAGHQRKLRVAANPNITLTKAHVPKWCWKARTVLLGPLTLHDIDAGSFLHRTGELLPWLRVLPALRGGAAAPPPCTPSQQRGRPGAAPDACSCRAGALLHVAKQSSPAKGLCNEASTAGVPMRPRAAPRPSAPAQPPNGCCAWDFPPCPATPEGPPAPCPPQSCGTGW
jgi:hypothetical protein